MDISNLTITPDLFYPKNTSDTWKPRCLSKVPSTQIPKKKLEAVNTKNVKKRFKKLMSNGPMLGRIGKIRNMGLKKNMLKKKAVVLKEMSGNVIGLKKNNNNVKAPTKQEEIKLLKHMKIMEKEAQERLFVDMNLNIKRKRSKGSSFKFFKSKNCQAEDEKESSLIDDDLVPEIQNYSPTSSAETSWKVQEKPRLIIDPEDFEDDCEPVIDGNVIESLLETLNDTNTSFKTSKMSQKTSVFSLDSLIETLEATGDKEAKKKPKVKFLGFGNNQLQIDAGQKNFGFAECKDCGFSYNVS